MKQLFQLSHPVARRNAANAVMQAEDGYMVEIKPRTRSLDQNAMLHALFTEASKSATWQGRKLTPMQWKVLFISGHNIATGNGADMIPGLESEYVNIRESSAQMSIPRMTSLIEYINAWLANNAASS